MHNIRVILRANNLLQPALLPVFASRPDINSVDQPVSSQIVEPHIHKATATSFSGAKVVYYHWNQPGMYSNITEQFATMYLTTLGLPPNPRK